MFQSDANDECASPVEADALPTQNENPTKHENIKFSKEEIENIDVEKPTKEQKEKLRKLLGRVADKLYYNEGRHFALFTPPRLFCMFDSKIHAKKCKEKYAKKAPNEI